MDRALLSAHSGSELSRSLTAYLEMLVRRVCEAYGCPAIEIDEALDCARNDPTAALESFKDMARLFGTGRAQTRS